MKKYCCRTPKLHPVQQRWLGRCGGALAILVFHHLQQVSSHVIVHDFGPGFTGKDAEEGEIETSVLFSMRWGVEEILLQDSKATPGAATMAGQVRWRTLAILVFHHLQQVSSHVIVHDFGPGFTGKDAEEGEIKTSVLFSMRWGVEEILLQDSKATPGAATMAGQVRWRTLAILVFHHLQQVSSHVDCSCLYVWQILAGCQHRCSNCSATGK